jgi:hypothetical protein
MPALKGKDLGGGPWHRRRGGRISHELCPVCRTPLHEELVERAIRVHPCCAVQVSEKSELHGTP